MRKSLHLAAIGMAALMSTGSAWAQAGDVVIMRKVMGSRSGTAPVTTPAPDPSPTPTPTPAPLAPADWTVGEWTDAGGPACTSDAPQKRTVACQSEGRTVDASRCTGPAPEAARTSPRYDACSYAWSPAEWSSYSSTCSADAVRTRSVDCLREGQTKVFDGRCADTAKPETVEHAAIYTGCSHSWKTGDFLDPGASCTTQKTQTRSVTCVRDMDARVADDAACSGQQRPDATRKISDYSGCEPYWYPASGYGDWSSTCSASAVRTREIGCFQRETQCEPGSPNFWADIGGPERECFRRVEASQCSTYPQAERYDYSPSRSSTEQASVYSGCGYGATASEWGACGFYDAAQYGILVRQREVTCTRTDGTRVDAAQCGRKAIEYQGCDGDGTYNPDADGTNVPATLAISQAAVAPNGSTTITYQGDGHLCIYGNRNFTGGIWCSGTHGYAPGRMEFVDGAIRQIAADGSVVWQAGAPGNPGSSLVLKNSGRLMVMGPGNVLLWSNF